MMTKIGQSGSDLATPAPTVWAACESVPVVIREPPASRYHLTIAGPGMLVFGRWRMPEVLISNAGPLTVSSVVATACSAGLNG